VWRWYHRGMRSRKRSTNAALFWALFDRFHCGRPAWSLATAEFSAGEHALTLAGRQWRVHRRLQLRPHGYSRVALELHPPRLGDNTLRTIVGGPDVRALDHKLLMAGFEREGWPPTWRPQIWYQRWLDSVRAIQSWASTLRTVDLRNARLRPRPLAQNCTIDDAALRGAVERLRGNGLAPAKLAFGRRRDVRAWSAPFHVMTMACLYPESLDVFVQITPARPAARAIFRRPRVQRAVSEHFARMKYKCSWGISHRVRGKWRGPTTPDFAAWKRVASVGDAWRECDALDEFSLRALYTR
jgi:hypothetical protein